MTIYFTELQKGQWSRQDWAGAGWYLVNILLLNSLYGSTYAPARYKESLTEEFSTTLLLRNLNTTTK